MSHVLIWGREPCEEVGAAYPEESKEGSRASAGELNCPSAKLGGQGPCGIGAELL